MLQAGIENPDAVLGLETHHRPSIGLSSDLDQRFEEAVGPGEVSQGKHDGWDTAFDAVRVVTEHPVMPITGCST